MSFLGKSMGDALRCTSQLILHEIYCQGMWLSSEGFQAAQFSPLFVFRFFRQTKLTSFQRQLNLYGFQRVVSGKDRGGYYHEMFLRGRPDLARIIVRTPVKGQSNTQSIVGDDPDFYSYTVCEDGKSEATITFTEEPDCLDDNSEKRGSKNKQNDFTGPETTRAVMLAPNPPTSIHDTRSAVGGAFFDMLPETMIANPMARLPATFPGFIQNQFTPNPLTALQLMAARNPQARHTLASSVQLHQNPNLDEESLEQLRRLGRL